MKKLKPKRERRGSDKHEGWAHPFGKLVVPEGATVKNETTLDGIEKLDPPVPEWGYYSDEDYA